jgi:hypothetical protein
VLLSQETFVVVGPLVHLRRCNYLRKRVLVWNQCFITVDTITSGTSCCCGGSGSITELLFTRDMVLCGSISSFTALLFYKESCVYVGALVHIRICNYLKKMCLYRSINLYMEVLFKGLCVGVGAAIHIHKCSYLKKYIFVRAHFKFTELLFIKNL